MADEEFRFGSEVWGDEPDVEDAFEDTGSDAGLIAFAVFGLTAAATLVVTGLVHTLQGG